MKKNAGFVLSPWSKRSAAIGSTLLVVAFLVACGDDGSDFISRPAGKNLSSSSKSSSSGLMSERERCDVETDENCMRDDRDGQTYRTTKIGDQVWMAENLNFETENSYCYNDSAEYCEKYGRFYTWAAAMDSVGAWGANGEGCGYGETCSSAYPVRGACPEGWHLPTQVEWKVLFTVINGSSTAGEKITTVVGKDSSAVNNMLKSTSGWNGNGNGTDAFSFTALPVGGRGDDGAFRKLGYDANFWSANEYFDYFACFTVLHSGGDYVYLATTNKSFGNSVRCLKD